MERYFGVPHLQFSCCVIFMALSLGLVKPVLATEPTWGNWLMYFGNQKVNERLNVHTEVQLRMLHATKNLNQQIYRGGLGIDLKTQNTNLLLGYGFIRTAVIDPAPEQLNRFDEHRVFQQFIHRHRVSRAHVQHRKRIEERFFEDDVQLRFRYFLAVQVPLSTQGMERTKYYLAASNEVFLLPDRHIFDRDRLYGALGVILSPHLRTEFGVMRQMRSKSASHQFQISIFNQLPLQRQQRIDKDAV